MIYLKDKINGTIKKFDDKTPKGKKKVKGFLKARMYGVEEGKLEVVGRRWEKSTKRSYDNYLKTKDEPIVDVESEELEE